MHMWQGTLTNSKYPLCRISSGSDTVCLDKNDLQRKTVLFRNYNMCIFFFNVNFPPSIKSAHSMLISCFWKKCQGFSYLSGKLPWLTHSFLDFTRNYQRMGGIFVPWWRTLNENRSVQLIFRRGKKVKIWKVSIWPKKHAHLSSRQGVKKVKFNP